MKVLILNSGMRTRMGILASEHPKCMTEISNKETILSHQLRLIAEAGIGEVVITNVCSLIKNELKPFQPAGGIKNESGKPLG